MKESFMNRIAAAFACFLLAAIPGPPSAAQQPGTGDPAGCLPAAITRLTWFGEQPDWRPDGQRVLFVGKVFGEVYEYELSTGRIFPCSDHFRHRGFTSAKYLINGDILLSGPGEEFNRLDPDARQHAREVCTFSVLDKSITGPPTPLGAFCQEMPAVSRRQLRIAWTHGGPGTRQDRISIGDIVYQGGVPALANVRQILQSADFPANERPSPWIETQNFLPPDDGKLTVTAYEINGTANTETFVFDILTRELKNVSRSPGTYDECEGIFPDGKFTLIERSEHDGNHWPLNDLYKLALDGSGGVERLTRFTDYAGYKGTQGVISEDGRFMVFQIGKSGTESGQGFGLFLMDLNKAREAE
jgi:hypothetical protein